MAKIYERLLSIQTYYGKTGGTRLTPNVKLCWARTVFFGYFAGNTANDSFFYNMIDLFRLF